MLKIHFFFSRDLQKKLKHVSETSKIITIKKKEDNRSIFPVPEEVNHDYGWLAYKKGFQLEKYGPDVQKIMPYKEFY